MPGSTELKQTEKNPCIEHCKLFGKDKKQRWAKEASPEVLSHLYEALGERLKLYTEHYRMPALISFYQDLMIKEKKKNLENPHVVKAVIDEIRRLDNPENDVKRAEKIIDAFKQESEDQWKLLEDKLNARLRENNQVFNMYGYMVDSETYQELQEKLLQIIREKARLLEKKETGLGLLRQEELARIREQQIALSISEVECQFNRREEIVRAKQPLSSSLSNKQEDEKIRKEVDSCKSYDKYTAMERIRDFCSTENLFQANDLMRELEKYSTIEEIAASDLYELEKEIKDKHYDRSTDYEFCLLPEKETMPCSLQEALKDLLSKLNDLLDVDERMHNKAKYELWFSTLKANKIYIQIHTQSNERQSEPVINYFVKSRAGGILEGTLTHEDVNRILGTHPDASTLVQCMEQGTEEDLVSVNNILQTHITAFKKAIYEQLEKQARELSKKKNGTYEEIREYEEYESYGKHVGIYKQSAKDRNEMIRKGFEYVFEHVMRPIAEERTRLFIEWRKLSEALEKDKARLDEIRDNPSLSRQSCLSWSTEKDKLTRKIQKLESSVELLKQKVDYLSGVLERSTKSIKEGKDIYNTPFSSITSLTNECSSYAYPDSSYRQNRTGIFEENRRYRSVRIDILNQARDYVSNFVRKLVGVILIPLRAILGSCAPESLQKQAFYNTQSAHRLFKAKSDWAKYNAKTEKEFGLPLRNLAL